MLHTLSLPVKNANRMFGRAHPSRERSFQLTQDAVGFTQPKLHDLIRPRLRAAVGVDAQLRRVARWPNVRHVAIVEIDAHAVKHIDPNDIVETEGRREEARQRCLRLLPLFGRRCRERRATYTSAAAINDLPRLPRSPPR